MQIQHLQNHQIDKARWLHTILQSPNGLIYAWPQYLDIMSPDWQALVNENYTLLMPLTVRKKWGIRYSYQPPWCQQLGIFGTASISDKVVQEFLQKAQQHIPFAEICLNYQNVIPSTCQWLRKNYILSLSRPYEELRSCYNRDLIKKNLQRSQKFNLHFVITDNVNMAIKTYQELYNSRTLHVLSGDYKNFTNLCQRLQDSGNAFVAEVRLPKGELLACGIFLKDENRLYNIASSTLPNGRTLEANHFLFDQIIQNFAGKKLLLDFEGSEIQGIERFYQKFGAVDQSYVFIKWNNLPWPLNLMKK